MKLQHLFRVGIGLMALGLGACAGSGKGTSARVAGGGPASRPAVAATQPTTQPALAITHGPYLIAPTAEGVSIGWMTSRNCVSRVEYGVAPDRLTEKAVQSRDGLIDADKALHRVTLRGLRPGTKYYYRVVSTEILDFKPYKVKYGQTVEGETGSFVTLKPSAERGAFVVLNDRHEKVGPLTTALRNVSWEGIDFVAFNGDMLNHVETEGQVLRSLIDPVTKLLAGRVPMVYVRGNHETRGKFARQLGAYVGGDDGRYYGAFSHAGARVVVLDGGEDKADSSEEYSGLVDFERYLDEETKWLEKEAASEAFRSARWRVVLVHIPPTAEEDAKFIRPKNLLDRWGRLLKDGKVDLVLSGHTHKYEERLPVDPQLGCPVVIGDTDSVLRVEMGPEAIRVTATTSAGLPKSGPMTFQRR